jgi:acetyltransferase-like isoleucine patch superfamily enzyme
MISILNKVISYIKKEDYRLDDSIKTVDLISIVINRLIYYFRGVFKRFGLKSCGKSIFFGKSIKFFHKNKISLGNGVTIGNNVEINALSKNGVVIGNNVNLGDFSVLRCTGSLKKIGKGIKIGDNCGFGDYSFFGAAGGVSVGNNVIMGQNVRFHSENHNYDRLDILIRDQGVTNKGIVIDEDCWVGAGVVFLDGVNVGKGSVIGANTLVNKDIPPYSVVVGNPMRIVKSRKEGNKI